MFTYPYIWYLVVQHQKKKQKQKNNNNNFNVYISLSLDMPHVVKDSDKILYDFILIKKKPRFIGCSVPTHSTQCHAN